MPMSIPVLKSTLLNCLRTDTEHRQMLSFKIRVHSLSSFAHLQATEALSVVPVVAILMILGRSSHAWLSTNPKAHVTLAPC